MSLPVLNEEYLVKIAGWDVVKQARNALACGRVLSSDWNPPVLRGTVQEDATSYRAGLVIKGTIDVENLCTCKASRGWGTICSHSVAVGLHYVRSVSPLVSTTDARPKAQTLKARSTRRLSRAQPGAPSEALELFVIFPPKLDQALGKAQLMLYFEGKWRQGRSPLSSLPIDVPFQLSDQDSKLLDRLEEIGGDTPAMLMVTPPILGSILQKLKNHPRVSIGKSTDLEILETPLQAALSAHLESNGEITLKLQSSTSGFILIPSDPLWVFANDRFQPFGIPKACGEILDRPMRIPRDRIPAFLNSDWPQLNANCVVQADFDVKDFRFEPQKPLFKLALTGGLADLKAVLTCHYAGQAFPAGIASSGETLWLPDPASPTRYSTRDWDAEQNALGRLRRAGFTGPHSDQSFQLAGQNAVLAFFAKDFPRLEKEWTVTLEARLDRSTKQNLERIEPKFEITPSGEQWFDLNIAYSTNTGERFSAADIQRLILSGQNHTRLKNGRFALIDTGAVEELQEVLLDCAPRQHAEGYRIAQTQAGFLDSALRQQSWAIQAPNSWRQRAAQQRGEIALPCPPLGDLDGILRPYQKDGVGWLLFLRQNHFGGILADEMGLGKTLQTLAFFRTIASGRGSSEKLPFLVVCPTSLVFNWLAEAQKFTPELKILPLSGPSRHRHFSEIPTADIVLTSYALIRRDADQYRDIEFDTVVLDEAQHIKNRQTQNALAVKAIRARHHLVLTGTPLENSVLDLWSIFDFLMPGYLGQAVDFRERYEVPITREKSVEAQSRLARRIRPFLLRRLKQEVAADLPPKIEQVSFCELKEDQQSVYQQVLEASRKEVLDSVGAQGLQKSRMIILSALLRLRQICCDLRLLKLENVDAERSSGKLDLFRELLEEVLDGGHRVLVFSQFVTMLKLLSEHLKSEGIAYSYLDGSTTDRGKVVRNFQEDGTIPIFLISLKAGGVGLNLTGADTVIHFDPWWNPAVEDQATDRAHRIGQSKVVTSYKLITKGTVEEKILNLQAKKRGLIKATLGGEEELAEAMTWEEIQELFQ